MVYHPRENWHRRGRRGLYTRRDFLQRSTAAGISLTAFSSWLAACGGGETGGDVEIVIGTPTSPATQPLFDDVPAIESGLAPEAGPLRIYNWADYINPDVLPMAEEALGVTIEPTIFYNEEEAFGKLLSEEVQYDVWFPAGESIGKAVAGKLLQPLNHGYLPNLDQYVWPELKSPFYDVGSLYSVPYVVYQTGIGWRSDLFDPADVEGMANPWDVFWNTKYKGSTVLYDDFRETMQMAMFRAGITEPRNATAQQVEAAANSLIELIDLMEIVYKIDGAYQGIPDGSYALSLAWSGDMVNAQYYFPEEADVNGVLGYLWPASAEGSTVNGLIANDTMAVLKGAASPVLAHNFINFMLDEASSLENFAWLGYQPPQVGLDPAVLVTDEWIPENLAAVAITSEDFARPRAVVPTQLSPETEALWAQQWSRAKAGG
jgi:spermidine/putrescine transport system substrate-binding protein